MLACIIHDDMIFDIDTLIKQRNYFDLRSDKEMILCQDLAKYLLDLQADGSEDNDSDDDSWHPNQLSLNGETDFRILPPVCLGKGFLA